jgi:hypothetical protein
VLARDRQLSKRLRLPSGSSWAARTASTGRLVSTERDRGAPSSATIAFPLARAGVGRSQRRQGSGQRVWPRTIARPWIRSSRSRSAHARDAPAGRPACQLACAPRHGTSRRAVREPSRGPRPAGQAGRRHRRLARGPELPTPLRWGTPRRKTALPGPSPAGEWMLCGSGDSHGHQEHPQNGTSPGSPAGTINE